MIPIGPFVGNIDNFYRKTWSLADQQISFGNTYTPSTQSLALLIEPHLIALGLTDASLKQNSHILQGLDISNSLLNDSLEYFQKALYNFNSQYILAKNGYRTWASVTNYYSSYFSIYSLLSLQGRAITRIKLNGTNEVTCLIHPKDFRNHEYLLTTKENRDATHKLPWTKYYDIYDRYPQLYSEFSVIHSKVNVIEPYEESDDRNAINYKIYEGFKEVLDLNELATFKSRYLSFLSNPALGDTFSNYLTALFSLSTDPDLKYFARSALRLILIRTIFQKIGHVNSSFWSEFTSRIPIWKSTMFSSYDPPSNYYEDFVGIFLS